MRWEKLRGDAAFAKVSALKLLGAEQQKCAESSATPRVGGMGGGGDKGGKSNQTRKQKPKFNSQINKEDLANFFGQGGPKKLSKETLQPGELTGKKCDEKKEKNKKMIRGKTSAPKIRTIEKFLMPLAVKEKRKFEDDIEERIDPSRDKKRKMGEGREKVLEGEEKGGGMSRVVSLSLFKKVLSTKHIKPPDRTPNSYGFVAESNGPKLNKKKPSNQLAD